MNRYVLDRLAVQRPSGRTAARLMLAVCDHFVRRDTGTSPQALAERFKIGLDLVREIVRRLARADFVIHTGGKDGRLVVPARPLEHITVVEVIRLFDHDHARNPRDDRLGDVFAKLDDAVEKVIGDTTYADLVSLPRRQPGTSERDSS
jgi:DNA-binding IscR family transcriptional regulator